MGLQLQYNITSKEEEIMTSYQGKNTVNRNDIEVGVVKHLHYHRGIRTLRKIIFVRDQNKGSIVQEDEPQKGIDLYKKIKGQSIIYPIYGTGCTGDGDIVIDKSIEAGAYLKYLGFPEQLDAIDLEQIYNIFLNRHVSKDWYPSIPDEERLPLSSLLGKEDYEKWMHTVNQLYGLKVLKVPTNVTMTEKTSFHKKYVKR